MRGKRIFLAKSLAHSGLLNVIRGTAQDRLVVFNYHRLRPDGWNTANLFDDGVFGPATLMFVGQIEWLKRYTRILTLDELERIVESGRAPHGLSTMVTFDDGYRDNYAIALPVLRRFGVPATFFIATEPTENRRLGWWDLIAYMIKQTMQPQICVEGRKIDVRGRRAQVIRELQRLMKTAPAQTTTAFLEHLSEACGVALPDAIRQDSQLMTWDHVRELAAEGFGIGSHTHTQRVLATLSPAEQEEELRRSKATLEYQIGRRVQALAYPVGGYRHFTAQTQAIAARCGYTLGFSFNTFVNTWHAFNRFNIKRLSGPDNVSLLAAEAILPGVFARCK